MVPLARKKESPFCRCFPGAHKTKGTSPFGMCLFSLGGHKSLFSMSSSFFWGVLRPESETSPSGSDVLRLPRPRAGAPAWSRRARPPPGAPGTARPRRGVLALESPSGRPLEGSQKRSRVCGFVFVLFIFYMFFYCFFFLIFIFFIFCFFFFFLKKM